MTQHQASIRWSRRPEEPFADLKYSRAHVWQFDGGATVAASSAPGSVPLPYSKAENVDPEEAFLAALSSCHMLTFLYLAAKQQFVVDSYEDTAIGVMARNANGRLGISRVTLQPCIAFGGAKRPDDEAVRRLHHLAHEECYIANSVSCEVQIAGSWK
jgi:organic hydroperoxide reductase OsmC/OhrA